MFERFTDRARRVLVLAQEEARLLNHNFIGTEHILLGLLHEGEGVAAKALESLGINLEAVRAKVEERIAPAGRPRVGRLPSLPGPRRCSSSPCVKLSSSATTTSAPSTCSWAWSAKERVSGRRCWSAWAPTCPGYACRSSSCSPATPRARRRRPRRQRTPAPDARPAALCWTSSGATSPSWPASTSSTP